MCKSVPNNFSGFTFLSTTNVGRGDKLGLRYKISVEVTITVILSSKSTGDEERGVGDFAPNKMYHNHALYFSYKCDRRPFWHNCGTRKEKKI